ncbi:MAG TPA: zinc-dependent alcohol dehydrogenase family protein [bacterium]|nr:zinc-dependent alcohol dehydrogenase family protein [bacterium]
MRALILSHPAPVEAGPLEEVDRPVPQPRAGEVLIRVEVCGVCHTDLHIVEGDLPPRRGEIIPGHQVVGRVESRGPDVTSPEIGERVGVAWLHRACGRCAFCRRGLENLCPEAVFTGYDVDGGFAEFIVAPAAFVYPLPDTYSAAEAAPLLCAGIIGYRALRIAQAARGDRIGLFGFGASAHLALQVARYWGCEVYVFTRSEAHRALAADLGAAWVGGVEGRPPEAIDAGVVFAPSGRVVVEALRHLRPGGTLAVNAVHLDQIPAFDYARLYGERGLRSVSNSTRADGQEFLALAAAIPLRPRVETWPMEEANDVLRRVKRGEVNGAAVLAIAPALRALP